MGYCGVNKLIHKNRDISNGMRKGIILVLLIVFLAFIGAKIVKSDAVPATPSSAPSSFSGGIRGGFFGGRIINMKATEIASLEAADYTCAVFGSSISIVPIGSPAGTPTSYFIPSYVVP